MFLVRRLVLLSLLLIVAPSAAFALAPRVPLAKERLTVHPQFEQRLVVKFRDDVLARPSADGGVTSRAGQDLAAVQAVATAHAIEFAPLIRLPEGVLGGLEARAAARSGRAQPDLAGMMTAGLPEPSPGNLLSAGNALLALDAVEWVYLESLGVPPPVDIPPTTDDLVPGQTYLTGNPGISAMFAWGWGAMGQGVRISDCEYGWNPTHEDFNEIDLHLEPGQTIHPNVFANGWEQHGTAAAGVSYAMVNEYGCNGMAPQAEIYTYPEWTVQEGGRRVTCITNAIAASMPGDVVLLEMQTSGVNGYVPAEYALGVWTVTKTGTDAGVIVVGAAGNGAEDLDAPEYADYMARGDSGAILVGAGTSFFHNALSFSTYGSRVNIQAWGEGVQTLGYGDIAFNGSDPDQWYTSGFSGTSSASSIAAPACALIQSFQLDTYGTPMSPATMRQLLIDTGWPQGTGGHIGPAINLRNALQTQFPVAAPEVTALAGPDLAAEPNPFRGGTVIRFALPEAASVRVAVFDVAGRLVRTLVERPVAAGTYTVRWDGRDDRGHAVSSGVYLYSLQNGDRTVTRRVVRVR